MRLLCLLLCLAAGAASATPPRRAIVAVGDSLTYGYAVASTPYPVVLEGLAGVPVDNLGVGGNRVASAYARWVANAKHFPYRVLVILIGTNDMAFDGATSAYVWGVVEPWIEEAQAAGQQVVVCTISPRDGSPNWDSTKEARRLAFNTTLRDYVAATPAVGLVDLDTVMSDDDVTLKVAYDYGDHLHFNNAGMAAFAAAVYAALP